MGKAAWRKIQISPATKATRIFPRENNKATKGRSWKRILSLLLFFLDSKKKIFKAVANPSFLIFERRLDTLHRSSLSSFQN